MNQKLTRKQMYEVIEYFAIEIQLICGEYTNISDEDYENTKAIDYLDDLDLLNLENLKKFNVEEFVKFLSLEFSGSVKRTKWNSYKNEIIKKIKELHKKYIGFLVED